MKSRLVCFAALLVMAEPAFAGEVAERLRAPEAFDLNTPKAPVSLEYCIADAISPLGSVAALNDGPNRVIVTASAPSGRVLVAVELNGARTPTRVIGHVYAPRWNDQMRNEVASCL